jgi:protein TonB
MKWKMKKIFILILSLLLIFSKHIFGQSTIDKNASASCSYSYNSTIKKNVYKNVSVDPLFPGGAAAWQRFLMKEFRYTKGSKDYEELQTKATAIFIVDTDGKIRYPTILKGSPDANLSEFDLEYLRVIKKMPSWIPGKCGDKIVPVVVQWPIMIHLNTDH